MNGYSFASNQPGQLARSAHCFVFIVCLFEFWLAKPSIAAESGADASRLENIQIEQLAVHPQWQKLLHRRFHPLSLTSKSEVDAAGFFLHPDGKRDEQAELRASLEAFLMTDMALDASAQCRFPARYEWLKQQLQSVQWQDQPCPEFENWRDELDAQAVTLVFPAAHINSPSSMYGHTLLRLDRLAGQTNPLLAYAVNFAADHDPNDNELVFTYKGLMGGYPGKVSIMPFYVKARDYRHMEYRNIWTYRLNFSREEVNQLVRHLWELKDSHFDYYFFDENCAYQIVGILDAASARSNLADEFGLTTIPVDTIRELYRQELVAEVDFEPSSATQMLHMQQQAAAEVSRVARLLVETDQPINELIDGLDEQSQRQALELAHQYARYLSVKKKQGNPVLRKRNLEFLSVRSRMEKGDSFTAPLQWPARDDEGHGSGRISLTAGALTHLNTKSDFVDLEWRSAYHDLLDPAKGFAPGAQIEMGKVSLRYTPDTENGNPWQLQHFTAIDVLSLTARSTFIKPMSWGVRFGAERFRAPDASLNALLNARFGRTWSLVQNEQTLLNGFLLSSSSLMAGPDLDSKHRLGSGVQTGVLLYRGEWQSRVQLDWQPGVLGDNRLIREVSYELGWSWHRQWQLRTSFARQLQGSLAVNETSLSLYGYF